MRIISSSNTFEACRIHQEAVDYCFENEESFCVSDDVCAKVTSSLRKSDTHHQIIHNYSLPDLTSQLTRFLMTSFCSLNHREKNDVSTTMNFRSDFSYRVLTTES